MNEHIYNLKASERIYISVAEIKLRLDIHYDGKMKVRISLGKHGAILRLPLYISLADKERYILWSRDWIEKQFEKNPKYKIPYQAKEYFTGQKIEVSGTEYSLEIIHDKNRQGVLAELKSHDILIYLPDPISSSNKSKYCAQAISKLLSKRYLSAMKLRVLELNAQHFKKEVKGVQIRNNSSNWGSCSSQGNISLNSKLLLTPAWVRDYIIIHELAHLVEHNHSNKYWALVERAMPNYMEAEKWLKQYGSQISW